MARLKTGPKIILIILAVALIIFGLRKGAEYGWIPTPGVMKALVPEKATLPDVKDALVQNVEPVALPGSGPASVRSTLIRGEIWEWNAQMGLIYANGGANTTKGSLMEKHGVNLSLIRQDDTGKMQEDLIACAREISNGASQCSETGRAGRTSIVQLGRHGRLARPAEVGADGQDHRDRDAHVPEYAAR